MTTIDKVASILNVLLWSAQEGGMAEGQAKAIYDEVVRYWELLQIRRLVPTMTEQQATEAMVRFFRSRTATRTLVDGDVVTIRGEDDPPREYYVGRIKVILAAVKGHKRHLQTVRFWMSLCGQHRC